MIFIENIVKFNAQTAGRDKLIRLCQYTVKFLRAILQTYHANYSKNGSRILDLIYKLSDLEQYFVSCRRLLGFGCCSDQFYSAIRSMRVYDPLVRTALTMSKFSISIQMFADHILWLNQMGFIQVEKKRWVERVNQFWMYSVTINLLRDFYEVVCVVQTSRTRSKDSLDDGLRNFSLSTPFRWARSHPKLSCDLIKNLSEIWIPYSAVNKKQIHPAILAILGVISTTMNILQVYDTHFRLTPC